MLPIRYRASVLERCHDQIRQTAILNLSSMLGSSCTVRVTLVSGVRTICPASGRCLTVGCCKLPANKLLEVLWAPPSRAIGYQMERLLGPSPVTTAHYVWRKPFGNGEDFTQYPTVLMHKMPIFGEIRTKFVRDFCEFRTNSPVFLEHYKVSCHEFGGNLIEYILFLYETSCSSFPIAFTVKKIQPPCSLGFLAPTTKHVAATFRTFIRDDLAAKKAEEYDVDLKHHGLNHARVDKASEWAAPSSEPHEGS